MKVRVAVMLKPGILDAQGATIGRALADLGFSQVERVRVGKEFELEVAAATTEEARAVAEAAAKRLLANPVIEDFVVEA